MKRVRILGNLRAYISSLDPPVHQSLIVKNNVKSLEQHCESPWHHRSEKGSGDSNLCRLSSTFSRIYPHGRELRWLADTYGSSTSGCIELRKNQRFYSSGRSFVITKELELAIDRHVTTSEKRHAELCQILLDEPEASSTRIASVNKELASLEAPMVAVQALRSTLQEVAELQELSQDPDGEEELVRLAAEELQTALSEKTRLQQEILLQLVPKDEADNRNCILEVRAGTGGEEASLFAMDVFNMYMRYAQRSRWKFEVIDINQTELHGFKEASASISGEGAYGHLKYESGVHRVQRVPVTEKSGRVHTSAASVAVLPEADEVDVVVRNEDLRIDTYRSGGAGGQSVNTTSSAVRVTHMPSGIVVAIQDERSQHMNKAKALKVLRSRLYDVVRQQKATLRSELRQEQIGSGDRSERIRTYNFPQGRVTDHRVGVTLHALTQVLDGDGIDEFVDALRMKQEMNAINALSKS